MFLSNNLSLVLTPLAQEAKYLRVLSQSETHTDYIGIRFRYCSQFTKSDVEIKSVFPIGMIDLLSMSTVLCCILKTQHIEIHNNLSVHKPRCFRHIMYSYTIHR